MIECSCSPGREEEEGSKSPGTLGAEQTEQTLPSCALGMGTLSLSLVTRPCSRLVEGCLAIKRLYVLH